MWDTKPSNLNVLGEILLLPVSFKVGVQVKRVNLLPRSVPRAGHSCGRGRAGGKLGQHLGGGHGKCFSDQGCGWGVPSGPALVQGLHTPEFPGLTTPGSGNSHTHFTGSSGRLRHLLKAALLL